MKLIILLITLASARSASIVPIDTSSVNVKKSGEEYSYSIHENRGLAISGAVPVLRHEIPVLKTTHLIKAVPVSDPVANDVSRKGDEDIQQTQQTEVQHQQIQLKTPVQEISYTLPLPISYGPHAFIPGYEYALTYPYGVQYPYNLIRAI